MRYPYDHVADKLQCKRQSRCRQAIMLHVEKQEVRGMLLATDSLRLNRQLRCNFGDEAKGS